jgi:L-ascorbate metabolism protein UlaG (beta-lactamase superfamily)
MNENKLYLKPNVVIEPLINRWYAWTHLVSPATAAMNIAERHLKIMESYLLSPGTHAEAVANPKMRGGPFMDLGGKRLDDVKKLQGEIKQRCSDQILFSRAVKELDNMLLENAKGFGLEHLYEKVPEALKGYVELFYDRQNNPSFRFFEPLLYNSKYYNKKFQSIAIWISENDHRPFALSTPKLDDRDVLHLDIAFDHVGIDELAKMKRIPQTKGYVATLLGVSRNQEPLFNTFFTEEVPPAYPGYKGDKIRMRYFGHACILIETNELNILVDPLISYYGYHSDVEHYSDADLPDVIDYVLITHNHQDHILFETLLPMRHKIKNVIVPRTRGGRLEDPELKLMFNHIGFNNVIELDEMETIAFEDAVITGVPFTGEHSDLNILTKLCYHIRVGAFTLMFMADSRILEPALYRHVQKVTGNVDVIFLGMECDGAPLSWLYGPLFSKRLARDQDGSRRLAGSDCGKGMTLVDIFKPKEMYVYAMGQEPWLEFISSIKYTDESNPIVQSDKLIKQCIEKGLIAERLFGEKELLYKKQEDYSYGR